MAVHVVVRRQLRLDVGHRDEAADPHHQALGHLRNEDFAIEHREVDAVGLVVAQQLVAHQPIRRGVSVVRAVDRGDSHAPVDMILLHGVGQALQIDDGLVELDGVGRVVVGRGRVAARLDLAGAQVAAGVDPAVDLQVVVAHPLAERGVAEGGHQRAVDRRGAGHAERRRTAVGPFGERHGRRRLGRRREVVATRRRCLRIARRRGLAPFERIVVGEALPEAVAEGAVEAFVVLVGVASGGRVTGLARGSVRCLRLCRAEEGSDGQRDSGGGGVPVRRGLVRCNRFHECSAMTMS